MKTLTKMVVAAAVAVGAATWVGAATPDLVVGSWNLNVAKSTFKPGPAPKSGTRTYTETADGVSFTFTTVAADGTTTTGQATYRYDGKDYPVTGSPNYDTLAVKKINGTTALSTLKLGGKVVGHTTRSVSEHGKVLTLKSKGKTAKGSKFEDTAVYDKQ
jgi:hypothetical protein